MRAKVIFAILVFSLASPVAAAHGANDFAIIMRGSSIQTSEAEILQNDSVTFYNAEEYNRTIRVDLDGDGAFDQRCDTEASNPSSIRDECTFYVGGEDWPAGNYEFIVYSNETLWKVLNLTVLHDFHEELGPPIGYNFNSENSSNGEDSGELEDRLWNLAIILFISSALVWASRRNSDG